MPATFVSLLQSIPFELFFDARIPWILGRLGGTHWQSALIGATDAAFIVLCTAGFQYMWMIVEKRTLFMLPCFWMIRGLVILSLCGSEITLEHRVGVIPLINRLPATISLSKEGQQNVDPPWSCGKFTILNDYTRAILKQNIGFKFLVTIIVNDCFDP